MFGKTIGEPLADAVDKYMKALFDHYAKKLSKVSLFSSSSPTSSGNSSDVAHSGNESSIVDFGCSYGELIELDCNEMHTKNANFLLIELDCNVVADSYLSCWFFTFGFLAFCCNLELEVSLCNFAFE
ncbi:hypothetical protein H5410_052574 [Solanum commersonii]|uniref:Uncharacterized protein n=1 Tax=Solanum commersonii TaxID=4109 RepID=A0A9J5X1G4_SOLCO|nr:hypothetical protein H5410_052574 [Solanum commersonii]